MARKVGDRIPEVKLKRFDGEAPQEVDLAALAKGRKIVVFGLPGAFTGTCSTAHMPSFIRTADKFREKGVDGIYCVTVNDVFVAHAWEEQTGAAKAGIQVLADVDASFTKEMGMEFSAPPVGLFDRSKRYAMVVEDGVITVLDVEENPGVCTVSSGEALLEKL